MWLDNPLFYTFLILASAWLLVWLLQKGLLFLQRRFQAQKRLWQGSLVSTLFLPLKVFIWFAAALIIADIICSHISGMKCFDLNLFAELGILTVLGWFLLRWKNRWVSEIRFLTEEHQVAWTPTQIDVIDKATTVAILLFIGLFLLEASGRDVQTLLAFGGIGGLVLAFASQQVISNFFGGLMIYVTRPFSIGEHVYLPERKIDGHIEQIGWYLTRLRNIEKRPVYIPNSIFTQTFVVTHSRTSHQQIKEILSLRYEDLAVITHILDDILIFLEKHPQIDQNQKMKAYLVKLSPNSLDLEISAYVAARNNNEFDAIRQAVLLRIAEIVEQRGAKVASTVESSNPSRF